MIDANVLFAALIKDSHTRHAISTGGNKLYVPEFVFEEVNKHISTLSEKTGFTNDLLKELLGQIVSLGNIKVVFAEEFINFLKKAETVSPDLDDLPYFALALKLGCAIWSNDKKLKEQKVIKVYSTEELSK